MPRKVKSFCRNCGVLCSMEITIEGDKLIAATGDGLESRLLNSLKRNASGGFTELAASQAMDEIAAIDSPNFFSTMTIDQSAKWVTAGRMGLTAGPVTTSIPLKQPSPICATAASAARHHGPCFSAMTQPAFQDKESCRSNSARS